MARRKLNAAELEEFLRTAEIIAVEELREIDGEDVVLYESNSPRP